ncbi:hypothetical protein ABPG75_001922 [Micractinium tetrahymenae]
MIHYLMHRGLHVPNMEMNTPLAVWAANGGEHFANFLAGLSEDHRRNFKENSLKVRGAIGASKVHTTAFGA